MHALSTVSWKKGYGRRSGNTEVDSVLGIHNELVLFFSYLAKKYCCSHTAGDSVIDWVSKAS